jgi:hypothetical protein
MTLMEEPEMEQEFLIFLMIFLKKYVTLLFQNERVCSGNGFLPKKKNQADFAKRL